MNKFFTLRGVPLFLALALPSLSWGYGTPPTALIVTETGSGAQGDINAVVAFLSSRMVAAGYIVSTNVGVPGFSMAGYKEVWDIRADTPLSGGDSTAYQTYLAGGGSLFVMGENGGCCGARDASITALILAAGGGVVVLETYSANAQTVRAPFTGPVTLSSVTYAAIGGFTSPGYGAFITTDTPTSGGAIILGPGTMTNAATGVLASVLDINFMDTNGSAPGLSQALTDNLIAYLGAPTTIPSPGASSFTMTGPSGGLIGSVSSNFRVTPNAAYSGTITITPSGGGLSTPVVLTFSGPAAQTFTITPTAAGPVTLTPSNSGSLTNPAALTYVTPPSPPSIGVATPGSGSASLAFTPGSTGGSPITLYTASCMPGSHSGTGASSPVTVSGLAPGATYICTVTATNAQGVSAQSAESNQVMIPATGYTLTGPAGGLINNVSTAFAEIIPNAAFTGTIAISVSGGGATAAIVTAKRSSEPARAAIVRTFNNSSSPQTFTISPTSVGPVTVTTTNNASLTDPPALNYATQPGAPVIGTATPGGGSLLVSFTEPNTGGSPVISFTANCGGGLTATGSSSPITVSGLNPGFAYSCTVTASNAFGVSASSPASNPAAPLPATPAPSTLVLFSIGAIALFLWSRRRTALA